MSQISDIFDIPESVHQGDFVLRLSEGVTRPDATLGSYVITPQLKDCFDKALSLIESALKTESSKGTYLHGSFGSGKSHFMAVLTLLLENNTQARSIPELADIVDRHNRWTRKKKVLVVPYHLIGATSLEQAVLGGYARYVRGLHTNAPTPGFFQAQKLFEDAVQLRGQLGDEKFFERLKSSGGDGDGWGALGAGWDAGSFDAAISAPPEDPERTRLVGDLIDSYFSNLRDVLVSGKESYVPLDDGLAILSRHAKDLGYDAVILFLDELVLWLASHAGDIEFLNRETQKVTKLVEAAGRRAIPLVSFIARQRDLRELVGEHVPGAEQLGFADGLRHSEARFDKISLEDRNLPIIANKRLLKPRSEQARARLDEAFTKTNATRQQVIDTLLTREGDKEMFRLVYPFSPALVQTLVALSSMLQRERTALKLMQQLLVNHRDDLMLGDVVPVGDLFDVIAEGAEPFNEAMKARFDDAKRLWDRKLRRMLEREHGLTEEQLASGAHAEPAAAERYRNDARILKTLVLSALADGVEALSALTPERLAALNHGTVKSPIPGQESHALLAKLRRWAGEVSEIKIADSASNPEISLQIVGIDTDAIIEAARNFDNHGNRIRLIKKLVLEMLELQESDDFFARRESTLWRGSKRTYELLFANVRELSDENFTGSGDCWRVIIDHPFDQSERGPRDDIAHMQEFTGRGGEAHSIAWLPSFLTDRALEDLGRLVILENLLSGNRLQENASHLSAVDRDQARVLLRNQRDSLRTQTRNRMLTAFGVQNVDTDAIDDTHSLEDHFHALMDTLRLQPPTAANMRAALDQLLGQALDWQFPAHPNFTTEISNAKARHVLEVVTAAVDQPNGRAEVAMNRRDVMRDIAEPLQLGQGSDGQQYFVLGSEWKQRFDRRAAQEGVDRITVKRLRAWIETPQPMGLDKALQDLVVIAYALQSGRNFYLHGGPVEPEIGKLADECELRTEPLPERPHWDNARERASSVFGIAMSATLNAHNVSRLSEELSRRVGEHLEPVDNYRKGLGQRLAAFKVSHADSDRYQTANSAVELLGRLGSVNGKAAIEALAGARLETSPSAVGSAISQAGQLNESLERTKWELFESPSSNEFKEQVASVAEALKQDEHVIALSDALAEAETIVIRLLKKSRPPPPKPDAPPKTAGSVRAEGRVSVSARKVETVLGDIRKAAEGHQKATVEIDWKIIDKGDS